VRTRFNTVLLCATGHVRCERRNRKTDIELELVELHRRMASTVSEQEDSLLLHILSKRHTR
jgi:hypothetical protein